MQEAEATPAKDFSVCSRSTNCNNAISKHAKKKRDRFLYYKSDTFWGSHVIRVELINNDLPKQKTPKQGDESRFATSRKNNHISNHEIKSQFNG